MDQALDVWVTKTSEPTSGTKALFRAESSAVLESIPTEKVQESFASLARSLAGVFRDVKEVGDFKLKEVELKVELTASGGFNLIGSANIEAAGAITLKFGSQ